MHGIRSLLTVFVAPHDPLEVFHLTLVNLEARPRRLDVTSYVEWLLGFAPDEHREFHKLFIETSVVPELNALVARKYLWGFPDDLGRHNNIDWPYVAFMAASEPLKSFDGDKESFIGLYESLEHPQAMRMERLAERVGRFGDAIAALQVEVALGPHETRTVVFSLGAAEQGREDAETLIRRFTTPQAAMQTLEDVRAFWSRLVEAEHVETPDPALNVMTNYWLKYQEALRHYTESPEFIELLREVDWQ